MSVVENINPLMIISILTGILSIYCFLSLLVQVKKLEVHASAIRLGQFLFFSVVAMGASLTIFGTVGYHALVLEEPVAKIIVSPTAPQKFNARLVFPDGTQQVFALNGDELLVDAYVLKWKSWANLLGLHTAYRLERVMGSYKSLKGESDKEHTAFAVKNKSGKGVAQWREDFEMLSFLLDVEHDSASFVSAEQKRVYQLFATTDGLLIRPMENEST